MAKIPGPIGTALGVAKVAKSAYKAVKRVQANKKNMVNPSKRKPIKKRNETPKTGIKTESLDLGSARTVAKSYKEHTGRSLRTKGKAKPEGSKFSKLTSTTKKQQSPGTIGKPGTYKSPTKRFNTKDMQMAVRNYMNSRKK